MKSPTRTIMAGFAGLSLAALVVAVPASLATATSAQPKAHAATKTEAAWGGTECFGLLPISGDHSYAKGCYGHDEPAIDPISAVPGSGQDISWTIKLPTSSHKRALLDLGPTFWIGASVSDGSSVAQRAFSELQFYPDSSLLPQTGNDINTACTGLGFNVTPDPGTWSLCDFTWGLYGTNPANWQETAAYVTVVDQTSNPSQPLYLHSGDVVTVHIFDSGNAENEAEQVITDDTTGQSGRFIMDSNAVTGAGSAANPGVGDGPLTLPYSTNTTDNAMPWGVVAGTPFAFSWEIGHPNIYSHGNQFECVPGQWDCWSYDTQQSGWGAINPLQILSATFDVGGSPVDPSSYATNDSQGGAAEDSLWCGTYNEAGTPKCTFPWYTYDSRQHAILFGDNYPGTPPVFQYGEAPSEYAQTETCSGPLTAQYGFLYYCSTPLTPTPPVP